MKRLLPSYHPFHLSFLNAGLMLLALLGNFYWQVFCRPSLWSSILLLFFFFHLTFYPLLRHRKGLAPFLGFLNALSAAVCLYCIVFLGQMNILGLPMILAGIGLLVYIPHFLASKALFKSVLQPVFPEERWGFATGIVFCLCTLVWVGRSYQKALKEVDQLAHQHVTSPSPNYFTEKIIGMHFLYHTRFNEYDGWRPPIHEPLLNLGMWLNGRKDPLQLSLKARIRMYQAYFPGRPVKLDCSCAHIGRKSYHRDPLWAEVAPAP